LFQPQGSVIHEPPQHNSIGIEQAQHLATLLKEHPTLKSLCGNTGDETELDMSGKKMGASDVTMLIPEIIGNMSLLRLSLADNSLGGLLPDGWTYDDKYKIYYDQHWEEQEVPPGGFKPEGLFALADAIKNNRTLTSLNLADNILGELVPPEGWTKTGDGIFKRIVFKHADGREQHQDPGSKPEGIIAIANAIPDMGALSTFTFSGDYGSSEPVTMETTMTAADFSGKELGVSGGMMVAAFLPKCQ
jgi:hypothetical protein